ncbi:hypothetical protein ACIBP6_24395 [Nonomuraea terrae]|uniref:hypothetical protein n=1 Tax=Nonomuraea terrae TaxID=2530383 RepID=UPI00378E08E3
MEGRPRKGVWTPATRAALAASFGAAARLRRGRPFHPAGVLFEARLRLHGTPQPWGAPFLDHRMDVYGFARFSRSLGLPPPLPDILGLALRWHQEDATADLLLATTGHTPLGRRLLRPATRWTGMYTSLFPYEVAGRRLVLGALLQRERPLPATFDALVRAADEGPLLLDLAAAAPSGPWRLFGQIELTAPPMTDTDLPTRFNPLLRQVPGLRPAGWLNEVRDAAYEAAQRVPDRQKKIQVR